jgi:tryptophan-rich sensory protein
MGIDVRKLIVSIMVCQIVGNLGTVFTLSSIPTWYSTLNKPSFTPPSWVFAPVWLTLYTLMGIALYLVWRSKSKHELKRTAIAIFGVQLFLNFVWSLLFFGLRSSAFGFVAIVALWLAIIATIFEFFRVSRTSGYLLLPYIAWVSIAALLNLFILIMN